MRVTFKMYLLSLIALELNNSPLQRAIKGHSHCCVSGAHEVGKETDFLPLRRQISISERHEGFY